MEKKNSIYTHKHRELTQKLKKAREDSGLNQKEAAQKLGKTQSYLSKIESGQRKIDVIQLQEMAAIYKRKIEDFLPE